MGMRDDIGDRASQVRFGDKGYSDVVKYTPPPPKPKKNRSGFVPSKPVGRLQPDESRVNNADIRPMAAILGEVAERIKRDEIYNQGLSAAERINSRGVIENRIAQNLTKNDFGIRDRDLRLAGEELRDARGNRFVSGVTKFDEGQTIPKIMPASLDTLTVNVKTIPGNCEVFVDGVSQKLTKLTPTILTFSAKEVLGRSKTITVKRIGYKSNEAYKVVGRIKREEKVIEKRVLDDTFDDDFIEYEPSFIAGGLNPMREGRFTQAGGLLGGEGFGFNPMREERDRIRERRNVKPRYKTVKEKIINEKFVFDFIHYIDGKVKNTETSTTLFKTALFNLEQSRVDDDVDDDNDTTIDDGPPKTTVPELLVLTPQGDNPDGSELTQAYSAIINGTNVKRINSNTFKGERGTAFSITLRAKSPDAYRIKNFQVLQGSIVSEDSKGFETINAQELNLDIAKPVTVLINFEKVTPVLVPSVTISPSSFRYNIANPQKINLGYTSENCERISFKLNKTTLNKTDEDGVFTISNSMFNSGVGQYIGYVCPYNAGYGDGVPQKFIINVVNQVEVKTPDIVNISYPEVLKGADFKGYDVDFTVSYQSVNTNFVNIYVGDKTKPYGKFAANQSVDFNVQSVIKKLGTKFKEDDDELKFNILLQPHNTSTSKEVVGKLESIQITFIKSDIELPREDVVDQLCDAFDLKLNLFEDDTSKYLTHLAHFGDGENKLIANWETDDVTFRNFKYDELRDTFLPEYVEGGFDSLILKMYEPLGKEIQPNQELWISKIVTQPLIDEVSIVDDSEEYCVALKGPNFGINECGSPADTGFELIDELVASGSQSSAKLIDTFVSSSGVDTKKLNIEYVSSSYDFIETEYGYSVDGTINEEYRFDNFVHFGSAEERARNYFYKLSLLETYKNGIATIESSSGDNNIIIIIKRKRIITKENKRCKS